MRSYELGSQKAAIEFYGNGQKPSKPQVETDGQSEELALITRMEINSELLNELFSIVDQFAIVRTEPSA